MIPPGTRGDPARTHRVVVAVPVTSPAEGPVSAHPRILKSLFCEAVLASLRTRYPQEYRFTEKLQIDVDSVVVSR